MKTMACFFYNENLSDECFTVMAEEFETCEDIAHRVSPLATFCGDITFEEAVEEGQTIYSE